MDRRGIMFSTCSSVCECVPGEGWLLVGCRQNSWLHRGLLSERFFLAVRFVVLMTDTRRVKCCIIIIIFSRKLRHDERVSIRLLSRAWAENLGDIWRRLWNLLSVPANFRFDTAFQRYLAARELCWWEPLGWLTIRAIISSIIFCPPTSGTPTHNNNNNNNNSF